MENIITKNITRKKPLSALYFFLIGITVFIVSCEKYDNYEPVGLNARLVLSSADSSLVLKQKGALKGIALTLNWTTGTNNGTGASISYLLQVDKADNNFSHPINYEQGKSNYSKLITVAELNDSLLNKWGCTAGISVTLKARIIATISTSPVQTDTSNVMTFEATPYLPVTTELYLAGTATVNGNDYAKAIQMIRDENEPTIFTYQGPFSVGYFKFPVNKNADGNQDMYMRTANVADSSVIYLHKGGDTDNNQWEIKKAGVYKITIDLYDLKIKIKSFGASSQLYMVGDATPNGWDIGNAMQMIQDESNPLLYKYDGVLVPGEFKFPVNRNTDWGQDMWERDTTVADSSKAYLHHGGDSDDNKWKINIAGWYTVRLNLADSTISYKRLDKLYIIGNATPAGWNIGSAIELIPEPSGYEFTYTGALTEGEFKFPINRQSDWQQDMFMKNINDANKIYYHIGGQSDDNKWVLTVSDAGNYKVTVNLKEMAISMVKQ